MCKTICITGGSSGLGYDLARHLHEQGYDLIVTVRKEEDRNKIHQHISKNVAVLLMDITSTDDVKRTAQAVDRKCGDHGLFACINNAGIVAPGPLMYIPMEEVRSVFEVNLFGLLHFTQLIFSTLRRCPESRIINMSSVSGLITSPFTGVYSSSKFALEALSDGMRRELKMFGIHVAIVEPGPVKTPIWEKNSHMAGKYAHTPYAPLLHHADQVIKNTESAAILPEKVSRTVEQILKAQKPKTRYIVARKPWLYWLVSRCLPDRILDRILIRNRIDKTDKTRPW